LTGLTGYFGDAVYSSHQVANGKPAPDLFLFAAANMQAEPSRCIVIEDSLYGVQGAVAAGMRVIGFVGGGHIQPGHDAALLRAGASSVETTWADVAQRILPRPALIGRLQPDL
jgi:beta-phosphoglucomutase-like phosphatase (HAD superfamily)